MDSEGALLLELERLRGAVETGFARMDGRLDGTVQRTGNAEKDIEELKTHVEVRHSALDARVTSVERKIWMAAGVAAVLSGGGAAGILAALGH